MDKLKVLFVTPIFFPATYWGGPIYSTYGMCNALMKYSGMIELRVITTDSAGPNQDERIKYDSVPSRYNAGYDVYFYRRIAGNEFSLDMLGGIIKMAYWADLIHINYTYSPYTIPVLLLAKLYRKPIIWSTRGALQRWNSSTNTKIKYVWERLCNLLVSPERCTLHVTSEEEGAASKLRIPNAKIVIIPNGVSIVNMVDREWKPSGKLRLIYMGRLHPIKGLENLFYAISVLPETITLKVYGCGEKAYELSLKKKVLELGLKKRIFFKGYVDGEEKIKAFSKADVCVVPSYTENFGMVISESMAHGVPVITTKGTPWKLIKEKECGWWVDNDPRSLTKAILNASNSDLSYMGQRGREWMEASYSWNTIAYDILSEYKNILGKY